MLFRRKLITNFIWIVTMITIVVIGAQYAFLYGIDFLFAGENNYLAELVGISYKALDVGLLIWIAVFLVVCIALFMILRAIVQAIKGKHEPKASTLGLIRILLVCAVFIAAIIYRGSILISSGAVILSDSTFYDAAAGLFTDSAGIGDLAVHGASYVYVMLLSFVMQFLGDRVVAVVLLQIVIQILTIILVFAAFSKLVNFCTGFVAALALTVLPLYTSKIFTSSPGCFVALLVVFAIWLISLFMSIKGGALKIVSGIIMGLIIGYLIYMDILCVVALVVWFFALMYEIGDEDRHKFLAGYLLLLLGAVAGLALSLCMDGGFDPDGIDIAVRTWVKVNTINIIPEYALIDPALGLSCLIQCMVMVGVGSWTILGTLGRDRVEYELPWILMFICAITPMTRIGYLHDNVGALIVYLVLVGAGISALFAERAEEPDDEDEEIEDDDETPEGGDDTANEVVFESLEEQTPEPAPAPVPVPAPAPVDNFDGVEFEELSEEKTAAPVPAPAPEPEPETTEEEVLPTSIPWASIKALDEEENSMDILEDDDIREEIYIPNPEPDPETTQVDDLPGMIPNPLPLPPKKKQSEMDFDLSDDDFDDEEDDLDWDDLDDDDDDDDFDI